MRIVRTIIALALSCLPLPSLALPPSPIAPPVVAPDAGGKSIVPSASVSAHTPHLEASDLNAFLDGFFPHALNSGDIAGAVVVVVQDGRILTQRGYGYSDVAKRERADPARTLFRLGSISKLMTWTAVMQLVEQGRLDLDRDANVYLDFEIPPYDGKPITLRQIMKHTAGFEEQIKGTTASSLADVKRFDALLKDWVPRRVHAPGTTPAYSNYATSLAGYIVQRVSKEPFEQYVERHIFAPLGMRNSTFRQPLPERLRPWLSQGYRLGSGKPAGEEFFGPTPAASLTSSAPDMARFMIAHLQRGAFGPARILKPETAQLMHRGATSRAFPRLNGMELGFYESDINGREVIAHSGDTQTFHADLNLFLDEGVGLFLAMNSSGRDGAASTIRTAFFESFADRYFPGPGIRTRVDPATAKRHALMLAGTWSNSRGSFSNFLRVGDLLGQVRVSVDKDGQLLISSARAANGQPRRWIEVEPFLWVEEGGHDRLAAEVVDGQAVRFSFGRAAPFRVFERTTWYRSSALLLPLLLMSIAALLLSALAWPAGALIRRRYGAEPALAPTALRAFRLSRLACVLILLAMISWVVLLGLMFTQYRLGESMDPLIFAVQLLTAIAFIGGFVAMAWNGWMVWRSNSRWHRKAWSMVLILSALVVLWIGIMFNLVGFGASY